MKSCLVLCSGGIDSVTAAAWLRKEKWLIHLLHIDYGQVTSASERDAVHRCAIHMNFASPILVDLKQIAAWGNGFLFGKGQNELGPEAEEFPNRNLFLLGTGAVAAARLGSQAVAIGTIDAAHAHYADCRPEFLHTCGLMLQALSPPLELQTPLSAMTKNEVVAQAVELGIPLELTFSCNRRSGRHCWECTGCLERFAAFEAEGVAL